MNFTPAMREQLKQMYQEWQASDKKRDQGLPTQVPGVKRFDNLNYGPYGKANLLDVYLPTGDHLPVIVNTHGGAYFYSTKDTYQFYGLFLAQQGFAVVNFNYRQAPDFQFPANIEDMNAVMNWVVANASRYHLDLQNVFIVGDSAGGQMAEQYNVIYTNSDYRHLFSYAKPHLALRAIAINCGVSFIPNYQDVNSQDHLYPTNYYFSNHQQYATVDLTKVEDYITRAFLPTYIMAANGDSTPHTRDLAPFLTKKRIPHEYHLFGDQNHVCQHVFNLNQKSPIAKQCNLDEIRFFKQHIAKG